MRAALALALLLASSALAGCLGATKDEAPEPVAPASEPPEVRLRHFQLEDVAKCMVCWYVTDNAQGTINIEPAGFDVKFPRPVNATLNVTWQGGPSTLQVLGNTGNVRFDGIVERGGTLVLPLEDFAKPSRVTVWARPAEAGVFTDLEVTIQLVLVYTSTLKTL